MQPKRHLNMIPHPDQLRWLGVAGLILFVPGGIPLVLLLFLRQHRHRLRMLRGGRFLKLAGR
ncbi:MAG: hypothetical protein R3B47_06090 [Bacteroidia bacterium]